MKKPRLELPEKRHCLVRRQLFFGPALWPSRRNRFTQLAGRAQDIPHGGGAILGDGLRTEKFQILIEKKGHAMKLVSAHIEDLRTLYVSNLRKALDMEQKITKALPDVIEKTTDSELSSALSSHLEETRGHVENVKALLIRNADDDSTETCKVIGSLVTEASDTIKDATNPQIRDIALIGAAQQVEHHEIAVYGTLRRWAEILGQTEDVAVLKSIENEEVKADKLLSEIAGKVNSLAKAA
jgi:ferritin-like metal-binding protein YciE